MKKILTLFITFLLSMAAEAQAPQFINYQAALRNGSGQALANQAVTLRLGIYKGAAGTLKVYEETHALTSNSQGIVQCRIGSGTPTFAANLADIDWSKDIYNLKVESNSGGGFLELGTQQLISVPYSFHSNSSGKSSLADSSRVAKSSITANFSTTSGYSNKAGLSNRADTANKYFGSIAPAQITSGGAAGNQLLRWNGTAWAPSNDIRYKQGRGITLTTGDTIHSVWTASGNDIFNNNNRFTGIGSTSPQAKLHALESKFNPLSTITLGLRTSNSTAILGQHTAGKEVSSSIGILGIASNTDRTSNNDAVVGVYGKAAKGAFTIGVYAENTDSTRQNGFGIFSDLRGVRVTAYGIYNWVTQNPASSVYGAFNDVTLTTQTTTGYANYNSITGGSTSTTKYAGFFGGNVQVSGVLSKSSGTFRIDHPQDPENKYLVHSFVESPDMMNVYNGNIVTGADGKAVVLLPGYFETLNREFRYQLTTIGQPAQVWVLEEISENRFVIQSDKPNVKVSWQVTGVRQDPWALKHPVAPEEEKRPQDKGKYLNPELYGKPETQGIHYHKPDIGNR
jgi:hypothetical protein